MEFGVFLVQGCMGDAEFKKRNPLRVARFFCREKKGRRLGGLSNCACFGLYGRRGTKDCLKTKKCLIKHLNPCFFIIFRHGLGGPWMRVP